MKSESMRYALCALLPGVAVYCGSAAAQSDYPNRPVKIIAPQAPGGGVDLVGRIIADISRVQWANLL